MRSSSGGCVANSDPNHRLTPLAKNMWLSVSARRLATSEPPGSALMVASAPAMPSALRVNCTDAASARNSRCREMAALMRRPKNSPA